MAPERAMPSTLPSVVWLMPGLEPITTSAVKRGGVMLSPRVASWKAANIATCARRSE